MKSQQFAALGLAMAGALALAAPASAVPITILNPSFENPDTGSSGFTNNAVDNWTGTCAGGPCTPGSFAFGTYSPVNPTQYQIGSDGLGAGLIVPNGKQAAYMSAPNVKLAQTLTTTLVNSTTYTLSVWIGNRGDADKPSVPAPIKIDLLAGSTLLGELSLVLADLPGEGQWKQYSLIYTSSAAEAHAGEFLGISLIDADPTTSSPKQVNFDMVTLNATAATTAGPRADVPEPMTIALFGGALVGFAAVRRRIAAR